MSVHSSAASLHVAVLLATRNGRAWLPAQIDSIFGQDGVTLTLSVADDASTDETWSWLQETIGGRKDVQLVRHEKPTGSAGANFRKLFDEAEIGEADYVALADQDDIWASGKLRRAIDRLTAHGAAGYSSSAQAFWPDGRTQLLTQSPRIRVADFLFEGAGQGCTFVIERKLFEEVRRFCRAHASEVETLHYHDWMIYLLARAWQRTWFFDPESSIRYRQHESNEIGARRGLGAVRRRTELIASGWYRRQVVAASRLYLLAGGSDALARATAEGFASGMVKTGWGRRALLAARVTKIGRRRLSDRLILVVAAIAGWL